MNMNTNTYTCNKFRTVRQPPNLVSPYVTDYLVLQQISLKKLLSAPPSKAKDIVGAHEGGHTATGEKPRNLGKKLMRKPRMKAYILAQDHMYHATPLMLSLQLRRYIVFI